jgi:hypothetical protein
MYCKKNKEYVEYKNCEECMEDNDHYDDDGCGTFDCEFYTEEKQSKELFDKLKNSEFIKTIQDSLSKIMYIDKNGDEILSVLNSLKKDICTISTEHLKKTVQWQVKIMIQEYMDVELKNKLNEVFKEVLTSEITLLQKDDTFIKTSIQEKILQKTKRFFTDKDSYNNNDIKKELNNIISEVVAEKTEVALEELGKETIEKFNKEAMKTMMQGMAKQLGSDKRLMKILTSGDFE